MAYTTVDTVAQFINVDSLLLTAFEKQQVEMLITFIDGVIDNYCGYTLGATTYTNKRFDGDGTDSLDLKILPVNSFSSVRVQDTDGTFITYTTDVELLDSGIIRFLPAIGGSFPAGTRNVYVTFNAGYNPVPADVAFAATYLVAINFNRTSQDLIGISEQTATNLTTKYDSVELPLLVKRVLDRYRKVSIF